MLKRITVLPILACAIVGLLSGCESEAHSGPRSPGGSASAATVLSIEKVLREDQQTNDNVENTADVVSRMRSIDLSSCPGDFRVAYMKHIHAWECMLAVERQAATFENDYNSGGAFLEAFLRGMFFDFGIVDEADRELQSLRANYDRTINQIRDTFQHVETVAVTHGARSPSRTH